MPEEKNQSGQEKQQGPQNNPSTASNEEAVKKETVMAAHEQAEKDMEQDPDLSLHSPNDDLDEGETARLREGKNDLI